MLHKQIDSLICRFRLRYQEMDHLKEKLAFFCHVYRIRQRVRLRIRGDYLIISLKLLCGICVCACGACQKNYGAYEKLSRAFGCCRRNLSLSSILIESQELSPYAFYVFGTLISWLMFWSAIQFSWGYSATFGL